MMLAKSGIWSCNWKHQFGMSTWAGCTWTKDEIEMSEFSIVSHAHWKRSGKEALHCRTHSAYLAARLCLSIHRSYGAFVIHRVVFLSNTRYATWLISQHLIFSARIIRAVLDQAFSAVSFSSSSLCISIPLFAFPLNTKLLTLPSSNIVHQDPSASLLSSSKHVFASLS